MIWTVVPLEAHLPQPSGHAVSLWEGQSGAGAPSQPHQIVGEGDAVAHWLGGAAYPEQDHGTVLPGPLA